MAHFTTAGFYLPVEPQDHWFEWIKAKQASGDTLTAWIQWWRKEEREAVPCVGETRGGNPRKVPVWRENHVKATDGSLQGLCKEAKGRDDWAHWTSWTRGNICWFFLFAIDSFTVFKALCRFPDHKMNWSKRTAEVFDQGNRYCCKIRFSSPKHTQKNDLYRLTIFWSGAIKTNKQQND